ncbi:MAG: glycyl-radical enzyme activating protein [Gemmatimonadetes bacterium]|nr:glycyl-radical enzyme activating protein [Gemmatimonadota bacterium]NNM04167.1 glycyl-radical enzyme activating protein [Gemmatimonadota bacterium]
MSSGVIFDVKRFAVHDGPGLRTTVFLKGCPLSCQGCHNPEGQRMGPELLFRPDRCTLCGDCVPACPHQAIVLSEDGLRVAWDLCKLEAACVEVCLPGALELVGEMKTVDEVVDLLEDDRIYFDESRGGVTFSGGEPFSQPDFLRELLHRCKHRELPVVLDTCGHVEPALFRELAPLAAHLLFDLKLMDEERHEAYTGIHNRWILENLRWASEEMGTGGNPGPKLTVRIPLIPGVNDDEENLEASARFLAGLKTLAPVDILPYHRLGVDKYDRMGREYGLGAVTPPSQDAVLLACRLLEDAGLRVSVRGEQHGDD